MKQQLYLHTIPVKFNSSGAAATWFDPGEGDWLIPVWRHGKDVYKCIGTAPAEPAELDDNGECPRCEWKSYVTGEWAKLVNNAIKEG